MLQSFRSMLRPVRALLAMLLVLLALPCIALAQEVGATVSEGGFPLAPIIAIGTALFGLLAGAKQWFPSGTHTILNVVILFGTAVVDALTRLAETHPTATLTAMGISVVGAVIARFKTPSGWQV